MKQDNGAGRVASAQETRAQQARARKTHAEPVYTQQAQAPQVDPERAGAQKERRQDARARPARTVTAGVLAAVISSAGVARAERLEVAGRVLSSEPVYEAFERTVVPDDCRGGEPPATGFFDLLTWDIACTGTETVRELTGYRVRYELDGRVFTQMMDEPPGATVPLLVEWR